MTGQVHGTLIAYQGIGILISGPSGSCKTHLAVEAMQHGAKFIADDQVVLTMNTGMLMGGELKLHTDFNGQSLDFALQKSN